jgi:hypothetical protein
VSNDPVDCPGGRDPSARTTFFDAVFGFDQWAGESLVSSSHLFLPCFPDTLEPPHAWKILDAWKHRTQAGCHVERDGRLTKDQGGSDSASPPVAPPGGPRMAKQTGDMPREAYFLVSRDPILSAGSISTAV